MPNYKVKIHNSAKLDLKKIKRSHLMNEFIKVIEKIKHNPYYQGKTLQLSYTKRNSIYSRRINYQHRVVYNIDEDNKEVLILSAWSHYE